MALSSNNAKLLFYAKRLGVSFKDTLMLGRLVLEASQSDLIKLSDFFENNSKSVKDLAFKDSYAEPLFELLGAAVVDSIDKSAYENASILHDLNLPISNKLKGKYSAVIDGGTLEHLFNFPVAIKNCMEALAVGGHFISFTPANNTFGHGFYQFSSELYYRIFSSQNGFKTKLIAAYVGDEEDWYKISDQEIVKSRILLTNDRPTHLIVIAEKVEEKNVFSVMPQQTDYQYAWELFEAQKLNIRHEKDNMLLYWYKRMIPSKLRTQLRKVYDYIFNRMIYIEGIGNVNPKFFHKMNIKKGPKF